MMPSFWPGIIRFLRKGTINLGMREFYCKMSVNGEIREAFFRRTMDAKIKKSYVEEIVPTLKTYCEKELMLRRFWLWDESGEFANLNRRRAGF